MRVVAGVRTVTEESVSIVSDSRGVPTQVRHLMEQINRAPRLNLDKHAQKELARLVRLLPDLVQKNDPYLTDAAELAVSGLMEGSPSHEFARSVRRDIESQVSRWKMPFRTMYRGRAPMRATLGLLLFVAGGTVIMGLLTLVALLASRGELIHVDGIDGGQLAVAAAMGAVGSIISIFVRVPQMSRDFAEADPEVPFFVGLFKPMIGIAFAVFAYAALKSGWLPLEVDPGREGPFFMAISFVAGFSERFVPDIISSAERRGAETSGRPEPSEAQTSDDRGQGDVPLAAAELNPAAS